jgi:plastocyanin
MPGMAGSGASKSAGAVPPTGGTVPASDPAAFYAGEARRGNGESTIPLARAERVAAQVPVGAVANRSTNTLRFTTATVSFVVLASPPDRDMTFEIAGMTDPTIELPKGAQVTVEFINGDSDMAHMWLVGRTVPSADAQPSDAQAGAGPSANLVGARPLGDPTPAGQPLETIAFAAPAPGNYYYYCAFPGHAAQGMQGRLLVRAR